MVKETDESEIATFIETGVITGGMIPKVQAALASLKMGVQKVNGKRFTEGYGRVYWNDGNERREYCMTSHLFQTYGRRTIEFVKELERKLLIITVRNI